MSVLTVEVQGLKELRQAFRDYPKIAAPIQKRTLAAAQATLAKHTTRAHVPFRTGFLLQSFRFRQSETAALWYPTAKYAIYLEQGTGLYGPRKQLIRPVGASVLSWAGTGYGKYVTSASGRRRYSGGTHSTGRIYAKYVKGIRPRPFMANILKEATPDLEKLFKQGLDLTLREIARQTRPI